MLNEFSKTVCAWALARSLYPCPEKLQLGSHFPSQLLEKHEADTASYERVVGACNLGRQPIFSVQGMII